MPASPTTSGASGRSARYRTTDGWLLVACSATRRSHGSPSHASASDFLPYPGVVPDPYREYSQPWFGTHKVLRGGAWMTRSRLLRNTWRNFYQPDRRDVWAGFRTCALRS